MEKGIEEVGGDDQGWHEVKKKRSSTKTAMKSNAREEMRKSYDQSEKDASNVVWRQSTLPSKGLRKSPVDCKRESANVASFSGSFGSVLNEPDKERIASVEIEVSKSLNSPKIVKRAQEERVMSADKPLKIKWGDLEDENLAELYNTLEPLNISTESLSCPSPNEKNDGTMKERPSPNDKNDGTIKERPSPNKRKDGTINDGLELITAGVLSLESIQEKRVVAEVSIMDTDSVSSNVHSCETSEKDAGRELATVCGSCQASCDEVEGNFISSKPHAELYQGASASNQELAMPESSASQNASADDFFVANMESKKIPLDKIGDKELSKCQVSSCFAEGEPGESKERFRERLWCFLFENLNRAVDELYLLCELECDLEQMTEALLVLEEAGSDFRDLKSRIEGFDKLKGASAQLSQDDDLLNVKSDRRRPHALSWEVRRMTTSPRRAEILSSSLEAFKKVQQERASKQTTKDPRGYRPASIPKSSSNQNQNMETNRLSKIASTHRCQFPPQRQSASDVISSHLVNKDSAIGKSGKGLQITKSEKTAMGSDSIKRLDVDNDKEMGISGSFKSLNAWKEKRNWENVLSTPLRRSSRVSHSPGVSRRSMERARVIHEKLMSPENKKKKTALDMRREAEEKHARAMRIRNELENERMQKLQRASEKLSRVNEWQAVRSMKLREGMHARHQRSESRYEAHLAQVVRRAGDESSKVNEVRFITSLNEENKKFMYKQKLQDSELRRAEKLQVIRTKQKEDLAREEAVLERRKILEAEKLQKLAETQKKKEEALVRREEERKASSAAREARAMEHQRRKEERAKAQQEEAELLAQKLAERLSESESRRKFYLEQIRERASMDFRDQSSPSVRRSSNKENSGKLLPVTGIDDFQTNCTVGMATKVVGVSDVTVQQSLKRRIKKIRQRLMALKHDIVEPPFSAEMAGIGYRTQVGAARAKIGRWLQDLQKLRQARKEGAANIGVIVDDMIKFLDGKDLELHMAREAGLLDFVASTLPASHTSKPEACQVTTHLLRLLRVVLSVPTNRIYFISQNLLPPMIPMLSAALENYIKMAATSNASMTSIVESNKATVDSSGPCAEVLEGLLCIVAMTIGHVCSEERQFQMQDGLAELIVAYQVVHRLHDLFAIFDRPQLEGSPFPSSILLSLNLLTVLISRSVLVSSINWDFCQSGSSFSNKRLEPHSADVEEEDERNVSSEAKTNSASLLSSTTSDRQGDPNDHETENSAKMVRSGESFGDIAKIQVEEHSRSTKNGHNNVCDSLIPKSEACHNGDVSTNIKDENCVDVSLKPFVKFLFSAIRETGLVGVLSLLTAVLLQANSRNLLDQNSYVLPLNFEETATGVLKVLNSMALVHIELLQGMLVRPDLKMEFFHLMSFLLSHCTNKWKSATDQVGLLLLETLLLLGYFSLLHPENQAVLRWGKSPTILHKVCDLPIVFFSDPELSSILAGTVIAACYGCEQNRDVIQQELSVDIVFSILKSRRQKFGPRQSDSCSPDRNLSADDSCEVNQSGSELKKSKNELSARSSRTNLRSSRVSLGKSTVTGTNGRGSKGKNQKESKGAKAFDEMATKPAVTDSCFMWLQKFPSSFLDRAEKFFSAESTST